MPRPPGSSPELLTPATAAEQVDRAKAVLMSAYDLDAATAAGLLLTWAAQRRVTPGTVAEVLMNEIWQGRRTMTEPDLARWLERCLRSLP